MQYIIIIFLSFFALRLISLSFSIRNEKRLLKKGGKQYGKFNSLLLTLAHIAFYFGALYEAYSKDMEMNSLSWMGAGVMLFAYVMLFYVMYKLRDVWTVNSTSCPTSALSVVCSLERCAIPTISSTSCPNSSAWLCFATHGTPSASDFPSM